MISHMNKKEQIINKATQLSCLGWKLLPISKVKSNIENITLNLIPEVLSQGQDKGGLFAEGWYKSMPGKYLQSTAMLLTQPYFEYFSLHQGVVVLYGNNKLLSIQDKECRDV